MRDWEDIKLEIKGRLDMRRVAEICGVVMRKAGANVWVACCPFHAEKSGSFHVGGKKGFEDRAHCFGCGWDGDFFSFWQQLKGCDFKQAMQDLAQIAGVAMGMQVEWTRPEVPRVRQPERRLEEVSFKRPSLPPLRPLRREECAELAHARGLRPDAVWTAARVHQRAEFSMWPMFESRGEWLAYNRGAFPSWCAIDPTRNCAEFRRLDNERYERKDGTLIKTWSTAGKSWPLGAAAMNGRKAVMLVEGGPDMLAAYDLLDRHRMLEKVAVVCMLGAGNRIREDALPFFAGCRVRIMVDADPLKDDENARKRRVPGMEAAARWQGQLCEAGAAVEPFYIGNIYEAKSYKAWSRGELPAADVGILTQGLRMQDGTAVKDVNDLVKAGDGVIFSDEIREAFRAWDF